MNIFRIRRCIKFNIVVCLVKTYPRKHFFFLFKNHTSFTKINLPNFLVDELVKQFLNQGIHQNYSESVTFTAFINTYVLIFLQFYNHWWTSASVTIVSNSFKAYSNIVDSLSSQVVNHFSRYSSGHPVLRYFLLTPKPLYSQPSQNEPITSIR